MIMAEVQPQLIFIDSRALDQVNWVVEKLLSALRSELRKQPELDAYVRPSETRTHDFTITYAKHDPTPILVQLIGIPDRIRAPIVTTAYIKG